MILTNINIDILDRVMKLFKVYSKMFITNMVAVEFLNSPKLYKDVPKDEPNIIFDFSLNYWFISRTNVNNLTKGKNFLSIILLKQRQMRSGKL